MDNLTNVCEATSQSQEFDNVRPTHRKGKKLLAEKKRRARINNCLMQIRRLVCEEQDEQDTDIDKMEKAEILEKTLEVLTRLRHENPKSSNTASTHTAMAVRYASGFSLCAEESIRYIQSSRLVPSEVKVHLQNHLRAIARRVEMTGHVGRQDVNLTQGSSASSPLLSPPSSDKLMAGKILSSRADNSSVLQRVSGVFSGDVTPGSDRHIISPLTYSTEGSDRHIFSPPTYSTEGSDRHINSPLTYSTEGSDQHIMSPLSYSTEGSNHYITSPVCYSTPIPLYQHLPFTRSRFQLQEVNDRLLNYSSEAYTYNTVDHRKKSARGRAAEAPGKSTQIKPHQQTLSSSSDSQLDKSEGYCSDSSQSKHCSLSQSTSSLFLSKSPFYTDTSFTNSPTSVPKSSVLPTTPTLPHQTVYTYPRYEPYLTTPNILGESTQMNSSHLVNPTTVHEFNRPGKVLDLCVKRAEISPEGMWRPW